MHNVGLGLWEEIGLLRAVLELAYCCHGVRLGEQCKPECEAQAAWAKANPKGESDA